LKNPILVNYLIVFASGCFVLLSFIVAINSRKVNRIANHWLAIFLLCFAIVLLNESLLIYKDLLNNLFYFTLINTCFFLLAPSLFFSVTYFVTPGRTFEKKDLWHFSLLIAIFLSNILTWYLSAKLETIDTPADASSQTYWEILVGLAISILPTAIYWFLSYKKLLKHQSNVLLYASSTETIDLAWLRYFFLGLAVLIVTISCQIIFDLPLIRTLAYVSYLILAFYLAYFALQQKAVFNEERETNLALRNIIIEDQQPDSQRKQVLTEVQVLSLKPKLVTLMQDQKSYLHSELGLPDLAIMMQLSTQELSYLINAGFETNFYNFVNSYRVEESKTLLNSPEHQHLSMVGIAFEAGFNSKTAFYTAFKKITGVSPTEFKMLNNP
jgi:AraC-like DNA-binding protein